MIANIVLAVALATGPAAVLGSGTTVRADRSIGCEPVVSFDGATLRSCPGFFWHLSGRHFVASRVERCPTCVFAPTRK